MLFHRHGGERFAAIWKFHERLGVDEPGRWLYLSEDAVHRHLPPVRFHDVLPGATGLEIDFTGSHLHAGNSKPVDDVLWLRPAVEDQLGGGVKGALHDNFEVAGESDDEV